MSGRVRLSRSGSPLTSRSCAANRSPAEVRLVEPPALQEHAPGAVEHDDALGEELLQACCGRRRPCVSRLPEGSTHAGVEGDAVRSGVEPPGGASAGRGRLRAMSQGAADMLSGAAPARLGGRAARAAPAAHRARERAVPRRGPTVHGVLEQAPPAARAPEPTSCRSSRARRIVEEGMLGETLFVVLSGKGKVTRRGRKVGEVLPGDFFGELSALDGGPALGDGDRRDADAGAAAVPSHARVDLLRDEPAADPEAARRDRAPDPRGPAPGTDVRD